MTMVTRSSVMYPSGTGPPKRCAWRSSACCRRWTSPCALAVYCTGTDAEPAVDEIYPTELELLEMSVKDEAQHEEGWAYYVFGTGAVGGDESLGAWQDSSGDDSCFSCHAEEAETDFVFTQFYPGLP